MIPRRQFHALIEKTRVLRFPRHRLATFGSSEIQYSLVSAVSALPPRAALRTGSVAAERPRIVTPDAFLRQFEGFGEGSERFERWLKDNFEEAFRGLEYRFRHRPHETSLRHQDAGELAANIRRDLDARDVSLATVIVAPEEGWPFALMKFLLEETSRSFPGNARELEERGLFDPARAARNRRRAEVESLFRRAAADPSALGDLGRALKTHGLFEEYQDRFFALMRNR